MGKAFNIGKLFGIQFRVHFSWFIIFFIVTGFLVHPNYGQWLYWVTGISTSILLFSSVLAHELAHSLVGKANGIPISSITLFIFGGVAAMTREASKPGSEFKMAIAGPVCSLIIGAFFGLLSLIPLIPESLALMVFRLAAMNIILAVFNLIPGFPLDGGRVFRSLLWKTTGNYIRSTRIAIRLGQSIGFLLIVGGIISAVIRPFEMTWFDGIWFAFIGSFLVSVASASLRQIRMQERFSVFLHKRAEQYNPLTDFENKEEA